MGLLNRIISTLTGRNLPVRQTNRGVPFTINDLEFVDEAGEITGCDYEYAAVELKRRLSGGVFPRELVSLLDDYCKNSCLETALDLIRFDNEFLVLFVDNKRSKRFAAQARGINGGE